MTFGTPCMHKHHHNGLQAPSEGCTESSAASSSGGHEHGSRVNSNSPRFEEEIEGPPQHFIFSGSKTQNTYAEFCEATRGAKKKNFRNAEERFQFKQQYESKKKTELCRNFEMYGQCKFGNTCSYAHGEHQL